MNTRFVHLHLHTTYSLLDGACRPEDVVQAAIDNNMSAVAITDHGVMYGAMEFYRIARRRGIRPVIGCEFNVIPAAGLQPRHLVLLAETDLGYRNLMKLVSASRHEGSPRKPVIDRPVLAASSHGLIALSAGGNGEIGGHILRDDLQAAARTAREYSEIFGRDHFFLEVQDHGAGDDGKLNACMLKLSSETGLDLVATNNVHYIRQEHAEAHAVLMCMQSQTVMSDPKRPAFPGDQFFFKSAREMEALFAWAPGAVARTAEIAGRCDVQIRPGAMHFPAFPLPAGHNAASYLQALCFAGLKDRYGIADPANAAGQSAREVVDRARHELDIIARTGFSNYYLVVRDFVLHARASGIPVGSRGACVASLVAYATGITDIDPIRHSLCFETFLNPEHPSPPDFGIDFCHDRRSEVMAYLRTKYQGRVAHIASFGTFSGRTAIREAARVLEIPHHRWEKILQMTPDDPRSTLQHILARHPGLRGECEIDPACQKLVAIASVLEGLCRNAGTHATGIVLTDEPLGELVPLGLDKDGQPITQYSMEHLAAIGLLKMDLLGLRTLTVIGDTLDQLRGDGRSVPEMDAIPVNDPATIALLNCGNTIGVFQLESNGMRDLLRRTGLEKKEDLFALPAVLRPAMAKTLEEYVARKAGRKPHAVIHPLLRPVLSDTCGLILYQEQVIQAACLLAGFTPSQADLLRRALGWKDPRAVEAQREKFVKGCGRKHRIPPDTAEELFEALARATELAYSKAHTVACARLSYRTAYLKTNHPGEYMAALLSSESGEPWKLQAYINEAEAMGLRVLPPHINESQARFLPVRDGVRFGLCAIRNVGSAAVEAVLDERNANGPYAGLTDFCVRTDNRVVHRKVIEIFVRAGCFDATGLHRARLFHGLDAAMSCAAPYRRDRQAGQAGLFDTAGRVALRDADVMPDCEPWHESRLLAEEKELLGSYVSGHPLSEHLRLLARYRLSNVKALAELQDGSRAITGGIVSGIELKTTHQGGRMAVLHMDCLDGEINIVVFPTVYSRFSDTLKIGAMLFACGEVRHEEPRHQPSLHAVELCPLGEIHKRLAERVSIHIAATGAVDSELAQVREILSRNPGPVPVVICLEYAGGEKVFLETGAKFSVMPGDDVIRQLEHVVGEKGVYIAVRDHTGRQT